MKALCRRSPWSDSVELMFFDKTSQGKGAWALPLVFEVKELGYEVDPTVRLTNETAQELMDELWRAGLRPSEGSGSAGSLRATERHLEDMRKLALDLVAHNLKGG